jgi:hypothetical protein
VQRISAKKIIRYTLLSCSAAVIALAFNNCGKGTSLYDQSSEELFSINAATVCQESDLSIFAKGYFLFLSKNCNHCHQSGPGNGYFANPGSVVSSFDAFKEVGYSKISSYAVSDTHNPPYTGAQNSAFMSKLRQQWSMYQSLKREKNCSSADPTGNVFVPQFETASQIIPSLMFAPRTDC